MTLLFAGILGLVALASLFVAPWVGGGLLLAAVIVAAIGVVWTGANAEDVADERRRDEPETPHMRGPAG